MSSFVDKAAYLSFPKAERLMNVDYVARLKVNHVNGVNIDVYSFECNNQLRSVGGIVPYYLHIYSSYIKLVLLIHDEHFFLK